MKAEDQSFDKPAVSINLKKTFPIKSIKLQNKKSKNLLQGVMNASSTRGALPKPPLALKKTLLTQDAANFNGTSTTEALLKMADEGLANIENELKQSKKAPASTLEKIRQNIQQKQPKQEIQANFNLSFNNSFNMSYSGGNQD